MDVTAADRLVHIFKSQPQASVNNMQPSGEAFIFKQGSSTLQLLHTGFRAHFCVLAADYKQWEPGLRVVLHDSSPLTPELHDALDEDSAAKANNKQPYYKRDLLLRINNLLVPLHRQDEHQIVWDDLDFVTHKEQTGALCLDFSAATLFDLMHNNAPGNYDDSKLRGWLVAVLITGTLVEPPRLILDL